MVYRSAVEEPNKGRYYRLGSTLTVVCHLPLESCGSASYHANDDGSGAGTISQTPQPNESYLRRLEDLKTCEQERQTQIMRMREEMREEMRAQPKA